MSAAKKPANRLDKIRIDLDTATREKLVAEVERLNTVVGRWEESWHTIVEANTAAWIEYVNNRDAQIEKLESLLNDLAGKGDS